MCVLINVASASEKTRDTLIERDDMLNGLATILVLAVYNNYIMYIPYVYRLDAESREIRFVESQGPWDVALRARGFLQRVFLEDEHVWSV